MNNPHQDRDDCDEMERAFGTWIGVAAGLIVIGLGFAVIFTLSTP